MLQGRGPEGRSPAREFTQLDIEMSFTDMDGILNLGEDPACAAFKEGADVDLQAVQADDLRGSHEQVRQRQAGRAVRPGDG